MDINRFFGFLIRRGRREVALLAAVSISVLLAAAVVSGSPIYLRSLELLGIDAALDGLGTGGQHVQVNTSSFTLDRQLLQESTGQIDELARKDFGDFYLRQERVASSAQNLWGNASQGLNTRAGASKAIFQSHTNIENHIVYLAGRHPTSRVENGPGGTIIEASVHDRRAQILQVGVGDELVVSADGVDSGQVTVRITGRFVERISIDPFWLGLARPLLQPPAFTAGDDLPLTLFVPSENLVGPVGRMFTGIPANVTWFLFMDGEALRLEKPADVVDMVARFESDAAVELPRPIVTTGLSSALEEYRLRALFTRVPMLIMAALALSAAVYGLVMVAGIIADRRRAELAALRSRGVSVLQIARMHLLEGLVVIGPPVLAAPLLAALVVGQLGKTGPYREITGGSALPVELSAAHFGLSALTGLAALLLIVAPAMFRLRNSVASEARVAARPDARPFFQRYFLDIAIIALGFAVWFELRERGALVSAGLDGDQSTDLTLLFGPALFLFAGVLAVLRVFPYLSALLSWGAGKFGPVWVALGLWRIARSPYQSAWTVLLIALVAGTAIVTGTLASTLERSQDERILYRSVSDLRVVAPDGGSSAGRQVGERLRTIPGVANATSVLRGRGNVGTTGVGEEFEFFSADPQAYASMAWFRNDFAGRPLQELMDSITLPAVQQPVQVPGDAVSLGVWVRPERPLGMAFLWAVLRDQRGFASTVTLGEIQGADWQLLSADLGEVSLPAELISVQIAQNLGGDTATPATVFFDDIEVTRRDGGFTVIEDFESDRSWTGLPTSEGFDSRFSLVPELGSAGRSKVGSLPGTQAGRLIMGRGSDDGVRGITPVGGRPALPAIASRSIMREAGLKVGEQFVVSVRSVLIPLEIVDTAGFLPPLDPEEVGFIMADLRGVRDYSDLKGVHGLSEREAIVQLGGAAYESTVGSVRGLFRNARIIDRRQLRDEATVDPLVAAGWRGIAAVSAAITAIAAIIGYAGAQAAHARRAGEESAYILSMGLTRGHFLRMLIVEHLAVFALGLVLGVVGGLAISEVVVDSVAHTEKGMRLLPPISLATSWLAFAAIVSALGITFAAAILARAGRQAGPAHGAIARIGMKAIR